MENKRKTKAVDMKETKKPGRPHGTTKQPTKPLNLRINAKKYEKMKKYYPRQINKMFRDMVDAAIALKEKK